VSLSVPATAAGTPLLMVATSRCYGAASTNGPHWLQLSCDVNRGGANGIAI